MDGRVMDPFEDPDYVLDSYRDSLYDVPVPCAICGGEGAWHIVTLAPEHIFFGPVVPVRGVCAACKEARWLTSRLSYEVAS